MILFETLEHLDGDPEDGQTMLTIIPYRDLFPLRIERF